MPVPEDQHIAGCAARLGDDAIDASRDTVDRLAAGHRMGEHRPVRHVPADGCGGATLVLAVVPLAEVFAFRRGIEPAEARSLQ